MPRPLFDLVAYLLDTSVIIEIYQNNGAKEAKAFWDWLAIVQKDGKATSIDKVQQELQDPGLIKMFRKKMIVHQPSFQHHVGGNCLLHATQT